MRQGGASAPPTFMLQLQIEPTAVCNARCHFCIYPTEINSRPKGRMGMDLFRKIIDEAATIPHISEVCITGLGESLLDPDLEERIRYVKGKMKAFTYVYTNGTYMNPERWERLTDAGLDQVLLSLNAADAETRKRVMGLDDWDVVIQNITYALAHERGCKLTLRAVINDDQMTPRQTEDLFRLFGAQQEGGRMMTVREGNWAGDSRTVRDFKPNEACGRALGMIYVTFDGKVTPCCFDPLGKMTFGDLKTHSLREVYNSNAYTAFRADHYANKADKYDICKGCTRI